MLIKEIRPEIPEDIELQFLRHLAYRVGAENGKFLSDFDRKALERLNSSHPQDTSRTSVLDLAEEEFLSMNRRS